MAADNTKLAALNGRCITVAVCGGIAAYKVADVVSKLVQAGATVNVAMTEAAQRFVTPVTFQSLSGRPVHSDMFDRVGNGGPDHLALTENADVFLVAPATSNMLAKAAAGICDDLVSTLICAASCPVLLAPAMNHRMWLNPIGQENVAKLRRHGFRFVGPEEGRMAEGTTGPGRLAEPPTILAAIASIIAERNV